MGRGQEMETKLEQDPPDPWVRCISIVGFPGHLFRYLRSQDLITANT